MARNFKPTLPQPPSGFEDRVINTEPRPVADNGTLIETKVWYANRKFYGSNIGKQDENLCDRVKKVKKVLLTEGHKLGDYPGESAWFLKETAWNVENFITLTLVDEESISVQAPAAGASKYHNSIEVSSDKYAWDPLVVGQTYTGKVVTGFKGNLVAINPETHSTITRPYEAERNSEEDTYNDADAPALHMYAWDFSITESLGDDLVYTVTPELTTATHLWAYNEEAESKWADITEMAVEMGGSVTITEFTYTSGGGVLYLRGYLGKFGDCCPKFGGNATAIEKVEGNLSALVDWKGEHSIPSINQQFDEIFKGCTALTDASGLVLPTEIDSKATHLFEQMFDGCTSLLAGPNLGAVQISTANDYVFSGMFKNCSALEKAPSLPSVSKLPFRCYMQTFEGCTNMNEIRVDGLTSILGDALLDWMKNAGTAVNGECKFYHNDNGFRWRYPSKSGIPGAARDNQKEWTPIPVLNTKLYFSAGEGGSVQAVYPGTPPIAIFSGESVEKGAAVTITAVPDEGYVFGGWSKNTTGGTVSGAVITVDSMPYGREEDDVDKIEAVATFVKISNLSVHYNEPPAGYTSDISFVRNPSHNTTRPTESGDIPMYAWSCVYIGDVFTESQNPAAGYNIWTTDTQQQNWHKSEDSYIRSEVYTNKITVLVFDESQGTAGNITVLADGETYRNWNRQYCACTATAGSNVKVTVTLGEGEALNWEDGVTDNPRYIVPVASEYGVMIRRIVPIVYHTVTFSCANGSVGATVDGIGIQSGSQVEEGKSVIFTITPNPGYTYSGTNPETVVVSADVTKAYECTPVPPTTPLFAYGIDAKVGEIVVENFILNGLHPSDHEIPGVEIPESYKDIEYYAPGNYFFFNTNPASATDFYMVTNSGGTWSAQQYTVNEWAPMGEGIDARHMFKTGLTSPCAVSALVELAESGEESIGALLYEMGGPESDPTISYQTSNSSFLGVFTPTEEHPVPYVGAGLYTSDESHTLVSTIKELNVELPVVH